MPLPWKKARAAAISGFISYLRSRRRRSPLLVQTGFPTSLADLVLKNSDRLKKPSSKKKIALADCSPVPPPRTTMSSSPEAPVVDLPVCDRSRSETGAEFRESNSVPEGFSNLSFEGRNDVGISGSRCVSVIFKVFLVVILALMTKEFAVGITASTILLFFLEFVAKHLAFCPRECRGELDLNRGNESDLCSSDCERTLELSQDVADLVAVEKIQDGNVFISNETQATESDWDLSMGEKRLELKTEPLPVGDYGNPIKVKRARNRKLSNVILNDKFLKKLVPKKFRSSKGGRVCKENLYSYSESSESKGEGGHNGHGIGQEVEYEEVCSSETSNETSSQVNSEDMVLSKESKCAGIKWHSGHLAIIVIVLFGLVGGRTVALLLTISGIFLAKSVKSGWRNLKKMYGIRRLL